MDDMFAVLCYFLIGPFFSLLAYIYFCGIYKYGKVKEPWHKWSAKNEVGDKTFFCGLLWPFTLFFWYYMFNSLVYKFIRLFNKKMF